jgi:hypothetical protein
MNRLLITFIGKPKESNSYGFLLVFAIFVIGVCGDFASSHHSRIIQIVGIRIRTALTNMIYKKV